MRVQVYVCTCVCVMCTRVYVMCMCHVYVSCVCVHACMCMCVCVRAAGYIAHISACTGDQLEAVGLHISRGVGGERGERAHRIERAHRVAVDTFFLPSLVHSLNAWWWVGQGGGGW